MARKNVPNGDISKTVETKPKTSEKENLINQFQKLGYHVILESGVIIFLVSNYQKNDEIVQQLKEYNYKGSYGFRLSR